MAALPEPAHEQDSGLPERDARILAFERQWWRHVGAKEEAIRSQFGISAARYYQLLNAVIDAPAAERHDPMLVRRLQRARDARTKARAERAFRTSDHGGNDSPQTESNH
ncbi:DUF3263 domain-containing protein [soil metagenome]